MLILSEGHLFLCLSPERIVIWDKSLGRKTNPGCDQYHPVGWRRMEKRTPAACVWNSFSSCHPQAPDSAAFQHRLNGLMPQDFPYIQAWVGCGGASNVWDWGATELPISVALRWLVLSHPAPTVWVNPTNPIISVLLYFVGPVPLGAIHKGFILMLCLPNILPPYHQNWS